ncbi:LytTR family DNA-binding domain-containing protein [Pseudomarimonas salicorniae]|uniref:LytTR family transcriptional regulator n=1 Tax=Pseudomarimonas salicorniae TaxID=2933270 RepID=A0ABT0GKT2_9GAMM|nr:LytTR family DNA-binding domain-containing protein [Lysobacter sp. CAU 1642]MCK7594642.1 LytTR family transcriptional regulator [Lysobacter sp. CAU 1642]
MRGRRDRQGRAALSRFLAVRRPFEWGFWLLFFCLHGVSNVLVIQTDLARTGRSMPAWEPWLLELSSMASMALLLPLILAFDRRFPLRFSTVWPSVPAHALACVAYSVAHSGLMALLRDAGYALAGDDYPLARWADGLGYEFLKDFRAYTGMLAIVYLYRFILLRMQGEASLLSASEIRPNVEREERAQRFLIKKLGKEFLLDVDDVEWAEAAGNYINLHAHRRVYPLRETMGNLETRLDPARFVRVHRSFLVNLDQLETIEALDSGDARIQTKGGDTVPVSRTYRAALRERLAGAVGNQ